MKNNTKPNRDITAEILKEFEGRLDMAIYDNESVAHNREHYLGFMSDALTKQKEEIVKSLRMRKKPLEEWMLGQDVGYNKAVDEFNQKLDRLK